MRRPLATGLLAVALAAVALELAGALAYLVTEGELFYSASRGLEATAPQPQGPAASRYVLHPVLGFIWRPSLPLAAVAPRARLDRMVGPGAPPDWYGLEANNYGYFAAEDYPVSAPEGEYLVGLFGGSVAQWLALQAGERLAGRLDASGLLAGRGARVLNFAQGGVKQPQQLQALAHFLALGQRLDFVVNLDGFNEVALGGVNAAHGIDVGMPSSQHLLPIAALLAGPATSTGYLEAVLRLRRAEERSARLERLQQRNRSAAIDRLLEWRRRRSSLAYWRAAAAVEALSADAERPLWIHLNPASSAVPGLPSEAIAERIAGVWMRSSTLMARLARERGAPYLHLLQPNQYHSRRTFGPVESRTAIDEDSPFRASVIEGYPRLESLLPALRRSGVHAESAVDLFDDVEEVVYSDSCCHLNQRGNEILADFLADRMIELISGDERGSSPTPAGD